MHHSMHSIKINDLIGVQVFCNEIISNNTFAIEFSIDYEIAIIGLLSQDQHRSHNTIIIIFKNFSNKFRFFLESSHGMLTSLHTLLYFKWILAFD